MDQSLFELLDKTSLDLVSLMVTATGVFAVLTKYSVPQFHFTFVGKNPFSIKRDAIETVVTRLFMLLGTVGVLLQAASLIAGDRLVPKRYSVECYVSLLVVGLIAAWLVTFLLGRIGRSLAKRKWLPEIIAAQRGVYEFTLEVIANGGYRKAEVPAVGGMTPVQANQLKANNVRQAAANLDQLESLFDLRGAGKPEQLRLVTIGKFFTP